MNVRIYTTDKSGFMREREAFASIERFNGIETLEWDEERGEGGFLGFGVAVTGSSCYVLSKMDEASRAKLLGDVYGSDGLGLGVARVSVGSSDYSPEVYCYEDESGKFTIAPDERYVLPMLKEIASEYRDVKFFSSPWSPPGRMKTENSMCGGWMRAKFIDEYVDYYLNFIDAYKRAGIDLFALTVQNETGGDQGGKMPACYFHPELEAEFAVKIAAKLRKRGDDVKVMILDHNFMMYKRVLWQYENCEGLLEAAPNVAFHYYDGGTELADEVTNAFPQIEWHFTEGGPRLYDNYATDWCKWGKTITEALNHGAKSFTGWNLALDETGGPNVGPFFCGGLVTVNSTSGELTYSGQYRAFDHFSRFVKRGATVYPSRLRGENVGNFAFPNVRKTVASLVVKNVDGKTVVQLVNHDSEKHQVQLRFANRWWYVECLPDSINTVIFG